MNKKNLTTQANNSVSPLTVKHPPADMVELSEEEMSQITGGWINDGWRRRNEQKALSAIRPDLILEYIEV